MSENEILAEVRRTREAIARETIAMWPKLFAHFREVTAKLEAESWRVAAPQSVTPEGGPRNAEASCVVREKPPES
jgi:hypothetical protein